MSSEDRFAEVKGLYVDPRYRGRGVAQRLVLELEARAAAAGATRVRLKTCTRQPKASALYEKLGTGPPRPTGGTRRIRLAVATTRTWAEISRLLGLR